MLNQKCGQNSCKLPFQIADKRGIVIMLNRSIKKLEYVHENANQLAPLYVSSKILRGLLKIKLNFLHRLRLTFCNKETMKCRCHKGRKNWLFTSTKNLPQQFKEEMLPASPEGCLRAFLYLFVLVLLFYLHKQKILFIRLKKL